MLAVSPDSPNARHTYAAIESAEHAVEVSAAFVAAGLRAAERVILIGLTESGAGALLNRLREDGAEPAGPLHSGQLMVLDSTTALALYTMSGRQVTEQLLQRARAAVTDGYTGIRFGGLLPGTVLSPHEEILDSVVRRQPASALCFYDAQAPPGILSDADRLHDRRVPSTALLDDGDLRVTSVSAHVVRLSGRVTPGNRAALLTALTEAARHGRRVVDAASLRVIDPESLRSLLTSGHGLQLRRPHPAVRSLARQIALRSASSPSADVGMRAGTPVSGQTASALMANLIWRTFGDTRPGRAESVLDWAGLLGRKAQPVSDVAAAHRISRATLHNRVRQVRNRGADTPLTPMVLWDVTRPTQATEDHLGRERIAGLLGLEVPEFRGR